MAHKNTRKRKRGVKRRHWCFTSFAHALPYPLSESDVRFCIYQSETAPGTGQVHLQGYIELFQEKRMGQVKAILGECHLEPRRGTRTEARDYCRKDESAIKGTQVTFGIWRTEVEFQRKLSDMLLSSMSLMDIVNTSPIDYVRHHRGLEKLFSMRMAKKAKVFRKDLQVIVYIGPTGCGKTRKACEEKDYFILPCSDRLWFDGYTNEKTLILDDFTGNIRYCLLLRILDGHPIQLEIKGGFIWGMWTKVIITSNMEPDYWYYKKFPDGISAPLNRRLTKIVHMSAVPSSPVVGSAMDFTGPLVTRSYFANQ